MSGSIVQKSSRVRPKTGGRAKGTSNKTQGDFRTRLAAYCARYKVDPHYAMVRMLADTSTQMVGLTADGAPVLGPTVPLALKFQCARELAHYLQPKLRSVVVTGDADAPLEILHRYGSGDAR
jgi:hypothetical protein